MNMKMMIQSKRKLKLKKKPAIMIATLVSMLFVTGTFAWHSVNQSAKNEVKGQGTNPGGRLHDDFNGSNKDVYVENFGNEPIFARVRIDEYFEKEVNGAMTPVVANTSKDDVTTWIPHIPGVNALENCNHEFHDYFHWTLGGSTVYMPTFNMNKDSIKAEINGTMDGKFGEPYDDYQTYTEGQVVSGTETWDADDNNVEDNGITQVAADHTAVKTAEANVVRMRDWDGQLSDTWVIDDDGWAYYAKPIMPKTATGLLLSGIEQKHSLTSPWYYGMNVIAQFATAGDWGEVDGTGFFDESVNGIQRPSAEAMKLLNKVAGIYDITITNDRNNTNTINAGENLQFNADVRIKGADQAVANPEITWEVKAENGRTTNATISATGLLTVPASEQAQTLLVVAKVGNSEARFQLEVQTTNR